MYSISWISKPGFGIREMGDILSSVNSTLYKFNQIIHGSADTAAKTTAYMKFSVSSIMTSKKIKDYVVWN